MTQIHTFHRTHTEITYTHTNKNVLTYEQINFFYSHTYIQSQTNTNELLSLSTGIYSYIQTYKTFMFIYSKTHKFIHKIFVLSFNSIAHSFKKIYIFWRHAGNHTHLFGEKNTYLKMYINKKTFFPHLFAHLQNYCKKMLLTVLGLISDHCRT